MSIPSSIHTFNPHKSKRRLKYNIEHADMAEQEQWIMDNTFFCKAVNGRVSVTSCKERQKFLSKGGRRNGFQNLLALDVEASCAGCERFK